MNTLAMYDSVCAEASNAVVRRYSTSFSIGVRALHPRLRGPIKAIYGFVRFADEIVDTFHGKDKAALLARFREDTYRAIADSISMNPILHSFQQCVNTYGIGPELIDPFLDSMAMDLHRTDHDQRSFNTYVMGSAEVVGLMCLRVFCEGDEAAYRRLKPAAVRLGAAFQKVDFLRDIQDDLGYLGRNYFPQVAVGRFDEGIKRSVEQDMEADFRVALEGIRQLPAGARLGVYVSYVYYRTLFRRIQGLSAARVMQERIRIGNPEKVRLFAACCIKNQLGWL
jgi:phytoene/squalene synthetase